MSNQSHSYGNLFFDYVDIGAHRSASRVLPVLGKYVRVSSVLDVGCGRGAWLAVWRELGVTDCLGVDGKYVDTKKLAIPRDLFQAQDISSEFWLGRKFDLVQCLEVAEHIPESRADILVRNLVLHGDMVLFSAAVPGQGGEYHVNEQPYEYWREKFDQHGYRLFDFLRSEICAFSDVEPWYRFNTFMFVNNAGLARLSEGALSKEILGDNSIEDCASFGWRLRTRLLRLLPQRQVHYLAHILHVIRFRTRPR